MKYYKELIKDKDEQIDHLEGLIKCMRKDIEHAIKIIGSLGKIVEVCEREKASLKARLEKAVELPCVYNTFSNKRQKCYGSWYVLRKTDHGSFVCENCGTKERAFARLAELKGGEGE